jgi:hypothetical protein
MPEKLTWIKLNPYVSVSCQPNTPNGRIVVKDHDDVSPSCVRDDCCYSVKLML